MPDGGRLLIRTYVPRRGDVSAEDQVAVEVQDSGIGVPPDRLEKIFEPFYTTKAQSGGTGLGLGLCRMLLSEMSGRIEVDSVPSKGSTFRMLLGACPERRS
jgi:signal transduction histidine kinase